MCCTHIFPFSQENPVGPEKTKTDVHKCTLPIYFHFHKKILLDQKEQKQMFINVLYPYISIFTRKSCSTKTKTDVYKCAVPVYFHFHKKILLDIYFHFHKKILFGQKEQKQMFINVLYPYISIFTRKSCWTRKNKN